MISESIVVVAVVVVVVVGPTLHLVQTGHCCLNPV